jgi:hypothetical protein
VNVGNGNATVSVTWSPSSSTDTVTSYTVTVSPGGNRFSVPSDAINIQGLSAGTTYQFTVAGTSNSGTGASTTSNSVVAR